MNNPIDVIITIPLSETLVTRLQSVSPRLNIHMIQANDAQDIPAELLVTAEILYTNIVTPTTQQAPSLRWIQFHWAGVNHVIEAPILRKSDLVATTLSGAAAPQMAEYILMMLLALGHHLPDMLDQQSHSNWPRDRWQRFNPIELRGSTVGIVGYGSIGRQTARLLHAFGAQVLACKRDVKRPGDQNFSAEGMGDPTSDLVHRIYPPQALRPMLAECDYVVITVPLTAQTQNLISVDEFAACKPTAFLVDVSRGGVVDHEALVTALREQNIAGAALDVFPTEPLPNTSPLWQFPNVIISPHISGNTSHYDARAVTMFIENLKRFLAGEPLLNRINLESGY